MKLRATEVKKQIETQKKEERRRPIFYIKNKDLFVEIKKIITFAQIMGLFKGESVNYIHIL